VNFAIRITKLFVSCVLVLLASVLVTVV